MKADKIKVAVLAFVLLGLGFGGCAVDGDRDTYSAGDVVALAVEGVNNEPEVDEPELDELPEIEMEEADEREIGEGREEEPERTFSEDDEMILECEAVGATFEQYREWVVENQVCDMFLAEDLKEVEHSETPLCVRYDFPNENPGLTSSNVRLRFGYTDEAELDFIVPCSWIFNLCSVEYYHEFINHDRIRVWKEQIPWNPLRIVFTTEKIIRDFRFFEVTINHGWWGETRNEADRPYIVSNVHYHLDKLAPEVPFVVTGASMGAGNVFASNGFSFVDEERLTRYFAFSWGNPQFDYVVFFHEF